MLCSSRDQQVESSLSLEETSRLTLKYSLELSLAHHQENSCEREEREREKEERERGDRERNKEMAKCKKRYNRTM